MIGGESREVRDDVRRWVEDGSSHLSMLAGLLHEYDRLRERVATAEREQERLRGLTYENEQLHNRLETAEHQCDRLRDEVARLRTELDQLQRDRVEVAAQLSDVMNAVLLRLRPQPS
jgi:predicted  nucleic acid-binding Zn-ribbon protein